MLDLLAFKATDFPIKNLVRNGDFKGSGNVATSWLANANITGTKLSDGVQTFIGAGSLSATGGNHFRNNASAINETGHKYYVSIVARKTAATGTTTLYVGRDFTTISNENLSNNFARYARIYTHDGTNKARDINLTFGSQSGREVEIQFALVVDLTNVFGAGNELTVSEMDKLLEQFPNTWFDGTNNLFNAKKFMLEYWKKIKELENAITALGGGS